MSNSCAALHNLSRRIVKFNQMGFGLLSGSVGLLNDSLDTILDLLSSLLVYLGVRFNRERLASIMLVACMTATSGFTLYEAVRRFFVAYVPHVQWFPFFAALLSAAWTCSSGWLSLFSSCGARSSW
jgi:divalent metal cation (Fe/Co/Zn/Cd) transporter